MLEEYIKEDDLEHMCSECGTPHQTDWKSKWDEHSPFLHYKVFNCENCNYEIVVRTPNDSDRIER